MPKVVLLVPAFPKLSETFILSTFLGLLERGWDAHVVCWESQGEEWQHFDGWVDRATMSRRVHVNWPQRPRWLAILLWPLAVVRCLFFAPFLTLHYLWHGGKKFGLDIFRRLYLDAELILLRPGILHFEFGALAAGRMYLKELLDCKVVVSFRGYDLNTSGLDNPHYYDDVWSNADAVHLLSEDLWRRAQQRGCPSDKPHVLIPPAIDGASFTAIPREIPPAIGRPERPLHILSVGRLDWRKGYEYALSAVRILLNQGVSCEYHIAGDGDYLEAVAFARYQLSLEQEVSLLGAQSPSQVKIQLGWADIFLHAAVSEGFCNAVIEAQAAGLPVVCTDAGGLSENVADGETGFVVSRRNPAALADALASLVQDGNLMRKMGTAGRLRILKNFQLRDQLTKIDMFYKGICGASQ